MTSAYGHPSSLSSVVTGDGLHEPAPPSSLVSYTENLVDGWRGRWGAMAMWRYLALFGDIWRYLAIFGDIKLLNIDSPCRRRLEEVAWHIVTTVIVLPGIQLIRRRVANLMREKGGWRGGEEVGGENTRGTHNHPSAFTCNSGPTNPSNVPDPDPDPDSPAYP